MGAAKAIAKHPQLLRLSVEHNLNPKLRYLAEEVGLGRDGAAKVILRCPQVLGFNVECNLTPKVRFLVEETGAGREGAADTSAVGLVVCRCERGCVEEGGGDGRGVGT